MNIIEPGIRNLITAKEILLTPYGLDESLITRTLAEIFAHKVDYADLYFQSTRSEAWSLEEGIVKSGSFSIDQGVGVRAVTGDRTAFRLFGRFIARIHPPGRPRHALHREGRRRQAQDQIGPVPSPACSAATCIFPPTRSIHSMPPPR